MQRLGEEVTQYLWDKVKKDQFNIQTENVIGEVLRTLQDYAHLGKKAEAAVERIYELVNNRSRRQLTSQRGFEFEETKKEVLERRQAEPSESEDEGIYKEEKEEPAAEGPLCAYCKEGTSALCCSVCKRNFHLSCMRSLYAGCLPSLKEQKTSETDKTVQAAALGGQCVFCANKITICEDCGLAVLEKPVRCSKCPNAFHQQCVG